MFMDSSCLNVELLHPKAKLPTRNKKSAGYDLYAVEDMMLPSKEVVIVPLGIATEIPEGIYANIKDRSGLAAKYGITTLAGVIDEDYRGEWKVILFNAGREDYHIRAGDRVAQAIFEKYFAFYQVKEVPYLNKSERGKNGFGSSGK